MIVEFREEFDKDLSKIDKKILKRIFLKIEELENVLSLNNLSQIKKLRWFKNFYRIRIWDYRLGFSISDNKIILERFLHRKDIYKYFPK